MSQINHIGGGSVAAEYRDYLARLGAGRKGRDETGGVGSKTLRTFDSPIDPDREPDEGKEEEAAEDEALDPQANAGAEKAESDDEAGPGKAGLLGKA